MGKTFPTLYEKDAAGKIRQWRVEVEVIDGRPAVTVRHGLVGGAQISTSYFTKPTNEGRANERDALAQAHFEAQAKYKKNLELGMAESIDGAEGGNSVLLPMLAQPYKAGKAKFPVYVQPKLNGVRCLVRKVSETQLEFISRKNKRYETLEHLAPKLLDIMKAGEILDGEIYRHGWSLQKIVSCVKKLQPETQWLQFWVYDVISDEEYSERLDTLELISSWSDGVVMTPTFSADSDPKVKKYHDTFVGHGFEGAILRVPEGKYRPNYRSPDLLKVKSFKDAEFKIVGGFPAKGTEEGCVVFTCALEDGRTFNVRPKGSLEDRRRWMTEIDSLAGKDLTVRYLELSDEGIPVGNTVGISIRDYE
jgi:DNA ligase-1